MNRPPSSHGASINFSLQVLTGDSTPMNWSSLESSLQPSYIPAAAWPAVFANLTASFGSTTESYLTDLDNEATYLSQLGEYTDDVQRLFGFAINTANDAAHDRLDRLGHRRVVSRPRRDPARFRPPV